MSSLHKASRFPRGAGMGEERGEILDLEGILGAFSLHDNMSVKSRQSIHHSCELRLWRIPFEM